MHPKVLNTVGLLCALVVAASATPSTPKLFARKYCGPKGCSTNGGSAHCADIGCDGACESGADQCVGAPECNTHFSNCRGTVEYDIAKAGGKLIERGNGVIERSADADEYVAAVLESLHQDTEIMPPGGMVDPKAVIGARSLARLFPRHGRQSRRPRGSGILLHTKGAAVALFELAEICAAAVPGTRLPGYLPPAFQERPVSLSRGSRHQTGHAAAAHGVVVLLSASARSGWNKGIC
ncbi:hypothetical protein BDV96DRAFT_598426 [Lophiotrema nucula]|uniref:Uncharacterized protein n=1 Tax=Lophiotrema nucula TaxID=690887 RepID=A0A6A5ZCN6_9PLEO|nr:hypothetical protein BDV96DRAFT_598426 [Lophiotrema nucula]